MQFRAMTMISRPDKHVAVSCSCSLVQCVAVCPIHVLRVTNSNRKLVWRVAVCRVSEVWSPKEFSVSNPFIVLMESHGSFFISSFHSLFHSLVWKHSLTRYTERSENKEHKKE